MSIIIEGMEMPIEGHVIVRIYANGDVCEPTPFPGVWGKVARADSIPEKHGRLIDADALAAQFQKQIVDEDDLMEICKRAGLIRNYFNESKVQIGMITFMWMLNDAKTIIPAEGGTEDGN